MCTPSVWAQTGRSDTRIWKKLSPPRIRDMYSEYVCSHNPPWLSALANPAPPDSTPWPASPASLIVISLIRFATLFTPDNGSGSRSGVARPCEAPHRVPPDSSVRA